jgi:aminomethyltransferase
MQKLMGEPISDMKYYRWKHNTYRSQKVLISRTGYTGEIGFEIYCDTNQIKNFFNDCIECGAKPAGLGARDTLRLEMGLPLYGHELNASRNPMESGYTRSIDSSKQFIGSSIVCNPENVHEILVGLVLKTRRASRAGDTILDINGNKIGTVTSGSFSPSLETAIALGYIKKENSTSETAVHVNNGRQQLDAEIASLPFYKKATGRKNLSDFI